MIKIYGSNFDLGKGASERRVYKSEAHTQATNNTFANQSWSRMVLAILTTFFIGTLIYFEYTKKTVSSFLEKKPDSKIFQVYWVGLENESIHDLPTNVNVLALAFADVNPNTLELETVASGNFMIAPEPNAVIAENYKTWTHFKYNNKNIKLILSLGGQTHEKIWSSTLEQNNAPAVIAKNIVHLMNKKFPVYLKTEETPNCTDENKATPECLAGYITLDGIDLDAEITNVNLNNHTEKIIELIHNIYTLIHEKSSTENGTNNKEIIFTGFSVGADPVDQCTVKGSAHCGEFRTIVTQTQEKLSWVNLMAYDAGADYAKEKYRQSMYHLENLFIPANKHKSILGLSMEKQWGLNAPETAQELGTKTRWAMDSNYGGVMFWAVGKDEKTNTYLQEISKNFISDNQQDSNTQPLELKLKAFWHRLVE